MKALSSIVNLLCTGKIPPEVVPHICGATLLAAHKKSGGHRPIAVGEVLRRLTSKYLSWSVRDDAVRILSPHQLGVGVRAGCEAIVHTVSSTLQDPHILDDARWCLLVDFQNAFISINRSSMFQQIHHHLTGLSAWMGCRYGSQAILHLGEHTILSQSGVQQGDPLGPLGFALTLHPIIERIQSEVP